MDDDALIDEAVQDGLAKALREIDAHFGLAGLLPPDDPDADADTEQAVVRLFEQYLEAHALLPEAGEALKVDPQFLQRHGGPLLMHMMQGIAATIVGEAEARGPAAAGGAERPRVQVDLSELLGEMLAPPPRDEEDPG